MEGIASTAGIIAHDGVGAVSGQVFWAEVCVLGYVPFPSSCFLSW